MVCSSGTHGTFPVFYFLAALAAFWLQAFSLPTRRRVVMARSTKVVKVWLRLAPATLILLHQDVDHLQK